jgi:hypothetical protein
LWNFKQRLKKKDDNTYAMMLRLQNIVVGTIMRTNYVYRGSAPYMMVMPGFALISGKPDFHATVLLIKQILHCNTNASYEKIIKIINI